MRRHSVSRPRRRDTNSRHHGCHTWCEHFRYDHIVIANAVDAVALESTTAKAISFTSVNNLTVTAVTADGALFPATTGIKTVGGKILVDDSSKTLTVNQKITSGNQDITLKASDFVVAANVDAGTACDIVLPGTGNAITLGTGGILDNTDLGNFKGGVLQIGDFTNTDISIVGAATSAPALSISCRGNISSTAAVGTYRDQSCLATNTAGKTIDLSLGTHDIGTSRSPAPATSHLRHQCCHGRTVNVCPSSVPPALAVLFHRRAL